MSSAASGAAVCRPIGHQLAREGDGAPNGDRRVGHGVADAGAEQVPDGPGEVRDREYGREVEPGVLGDRADGRATRGPRGLRLGSWAAKVAFLPLGCVNSLGDPWTSPSTALMLERRLGSRSSSGRGRRVRPWNVQFRAGEVAAVLTGIGFRVRRRLRNGADALPFLGAVLGPVLAELSSTWVPQLTCDLVHDHGC